MRLFAKLEGGIVTSKAWEDALKDLTGWTDISAYPFVEEGQNLTAVVLDRARRRHGLVIEQAYLEAMQGGFSSSALGTAHRYASDGLAMTLLVGAVSAAQSREFECTDANGVTAMRLHTAAQLAQVLNDGAILAVSYKQKKRTLLSQIATATTVDAIETVKW